jgi:hypothetical protein
MNYDFEPVDALVEQLKGNTNFLQKVLFSRVGLATAIVLSGLFLIAAIK